MNIAIDVLAILGPGSKNRGIGNYTISQLKKLFEIDKQNKYFLLNFYEDTNLKSLLNYSDNVVERYFFMGPDNIFLKNIKYAQVVEGIIKNFIKKNEIDVFYFTSPCDGSISYDIKWFENVKTVATLYDIIPYLFKDRYLGNRSMYMEYMGWIKKMKSCDKLLAISESAKNDFVENFETNPNKIEVIYAGVDEEYKKIDIPNTEKTYILKKYSIEDDYIMCTGGDDDRKNISGLIIAYSKLPKHLIEKYQLVIVCKLSNTSEERYYNIANNHQVRNRVILTNFVPIEDLVKLYNLAHIVAFPSQYEGFGLPIVEAMGCETPVLTSNNSSLGEIAQRAAVLVNPFDTKDITRGLIEILEETDLNELVQKGRERVKVFDWEKVAERTLEAFHSFYNEDRDEQIQIKANCKIAFFTPLPPKQSGIADYSVDILNEMSKYITIDVYIDSNYIPVCELNKNIQVFNFQQFNAKKHEYIDIIYQVGNSDYHYYMIDFIRQYPGTVVLHDYNLHGLIHYSAVKKGIKVYYKKFLYEDYASQVVDKYVSDFFAGKVAIKDFEMPSNGIVANYAKKIVVHSEYSKKLLLEKDITRKIRVIPSYAKIEKVIDLSESKRKLNIPEGQIVLSAFGHIHETKRIVPILKAFKYLLEHQRNVILYLVGKPSSSIKQEIESYINSNEIADKVNITGFIDLEAFQSYIDATDICLNLRYPYNGETSGSLMRILSKGKCAIVNDLGSFSEIPDNSCIKLKSPEDLTESQEIEMIFTKLLKLISNKELIQQIGKNAREYAEKNLNIEHIVKEYIEYMVSNPVPTLTNELLTNLQEEIKAGLWNQNELFKISATLAYLK